MNIDLSLIPPGERVLCAVSGGADSMCLLHLLHSRRRELGIEVAAAHFEHGLRGEESLRDARFVASWCAENGIPCRVGHGDVRSFAAEKSLSTEEAARVLRYDFLLSAAEKLGCARIATAHNADDNAETVIFNLARGSGALGLCGIPPARGNIVRPLLGVTRAEIEAYLEENKLPHVEDSSNASDEYSRNLIRHKVLPALRQINGGCALAVGRTVRLLREDEDCLGAMARKFIEERFDGASVPAGELAALHRAVSSRVVRQLCGTGLSQRHVDAVLGLCGGGAACCADLPGRRVRCERGRLYFSAGEGSGIAARPIVPGETVLIPEAGLRIRADVTNFSEEIHGLFKTYHFKYDNICGNIFCTGRQPGDRLRPAGRGCTKTMKNIFSEAGLTLAQRALTPILRDDKGVLAAVGLAVDERTVPSPGDRVLRIRIENI